MKLRNKKTGEIGELHYEPDKEYHFTVATEDPADMMIFKTLAELERDWEDYEEPKEIWYIDWQGGIRSADIDNKWEREKAIGNYFSSREEAELAVRKLKAWKRLKDEYDFKFTGWKRDEQFRGDFIITAQDWNTSDDRLLDLLFGGEE